MPGQPTDRELHSRLFYAILFPPEIVSAISSLIRRLGKYDLDRSVRWSPPENLHLTLRFLGEVSPEQAERAKDIPEEIPPTGTITLVSGPTDAFPSLTKPRVLTLAVSGVDSPNTARLLRLQSFLEAEAVRLGLPGERRAFRPHITLGRVRRGRSVSSELKRAFVEPGFRKNDPFECGRLSLMESHLGEMGARYEEIASWPLNDLSEAGPSHRDAS